MLDSISFDGGQNVHAWESKFELLRLYKPINGNNSVSSRYSTKEGVRLNFVSFDWDPLTNEHKSKFYLQCRYKSISGNTNISGSRSMKEGVKLGFWVSTQHTIHHQGKKN